MKPWVLAQDRDLVDLLDGLPGLVEGVTGAPAFREGPWRIVKRGAVTYQADAMVGAPKDDVVIATARAFGYARTGQQVEGRIAGVVDWLIESRRLTERVGFVGAA